MTTTSKWSVGLAAHERSLVGYKSLAEEVGMAQMRKVNEKNRVFWVISFLLDQSPNLNKYIFLISDYIFVNVD